MATLKFQTHGNEKQKEAFKYLLGYPEITEIGYGGAAGGGKSYTGVAWVWMMCNKYPGVRYFFGREELKRLKQTTLATYFKFLGDYQIPESQKGVYNSQDSVIKFSNGSEILLLDLAYLPSDPLYTRFGSLELTGGYIDESAEIDEQCVTILMTRIGRQKNEEYGLAPKLLEGFNPDKGQVYRRYYKPWKEGNLPLYRVFIRALATDNKLLPKSYIEQLNKANEVTKQRLLYGNFDYDDTPGRLFDYNSILNLWNNAEQRGKKYITVDVARLGKDETVIRIWDGLVNTRIIREPKSRIDELTKRIQILAQEEGVETKNIIVDEDGVGGGLVDNLRCQGFVNNSRPLQPKTVKRNYQNLKTQCYFYLADYVNQGKIRIIPEDRLLSEELDAVVQIDLDKDATLKIFPKEDMKDKLGRSPDSSDSLMMRMFYEIHKITMEKVEIKPQHDPEEDPLGIFIDDFIDEEETVLSPY